MCTPKDIVISLPETNYTEVLTQKTLAPTRILITLCQKTVCVVTYPVTKLTELGHEPKKLISRVSTLNCYLSHLLRHIKAKFENNLSVHQYRIG